MIEAATAFDDDVLEARRLRGRHHLEAGLARLARQLDPARQDVVELDRGQVGLDAELGGLVRAARDLARELDRQRATDGRAEIEAETRAARIVQRRLQADVRIALGLLAIVERGRLPVDLDVALDLVALVARDDLQIVGLQLLVHHQLVGGKAVEIGGDGVGGVGLGQLALDRQAELDVRRERSPAGVGIDDGRRQIAQPVIGEHFGRRRHGSVDAKPGARGRGFGCHVRHLEDEVGDRDLAAGGRVGNALPDAHGGGAPGHARLQIGIVHDRHAVHRADRDAARHDVDREAVVGNGRALPWKVPGRRIDADLDALERAALDPLDHPFAQFRNDERRPHPLERGSRHRRSRKAQREPRLAGIVDSAGAGDADLAIADIGLRQQEALVVGIEAQTDRNAVEDERRLVVDAAQQDRAAAEAELPVVDAAVGRLQMRQQRQAVRTRENLERCDQHAPIGVPLDIDLGRVDRHRIIGRVGVDDVARADRDLAAEEGRHAVAAELALELAGSAAGRRYR
ncbi:hypothetical protein ACVJGC_000064 [Bradyrhizobium diazoefficiens]